MTPIRRSATARRTTVRRTVAAGAALGLGLALAACGATAAPTTTTTTDATETTVATVTTDNAPDHDDPADYTWDAADEVDLELTGTSATSNSDAVTIDGGTVTITAAGTYRISGTLTDGQLVVDTTDDGVVRLVLDDAEVTSSTGSALAVLDAEKAVVILADGSTNTLTDAETYTFPDATTDEPNAALFSAADLTIGGTGSLTVTGRYNDAIASKDGLVISGGTIAVTAADDGIRGKDYLVVRGGELTVDAGGDGLKSDNADDATMGYISVEAGAVTVGAGGDGFDAETDVLLSGGDVTVTAGGGASATLAADASAKGVKGAVSVIVSGGTLDVDAADDAVHSNADVTISSGILTLATGDDAVHADAALAVTGGTITVAESYEGLEGAQIAIAGGEIDVRSTDDGVNVAGGVDGSGQAAPAAQGDAMGGQAGGAGQGGPADDTFAVSDEYWLDISGGTVVIDADGDGLDANGNVTMTGGTVTVHGPTSEGNGAIDVDGTFTVDGGTLLAAGSAGMAMTPSTTSSQTVLGIQFGTRVGAGSVVEIRTADATVVTFTAVKDAATLVVSSPDLVAGTEYDVVVDGTSLGAVTAS